MKEKVTAVGRFLRKLRIDYCEVLYDMAQKLGCSSAFISAIELGKRPIPTEYVTKITELYDLSQERRQDFQQAIELTAKTITINLEELNDTSRSAAFTFARRLKTMQEKEVEKLMKLLEQSHSQDNKHK